MRLLVTRPAEDAAELAAVLTARRHDVLCDPLLEIRPVAGSEVSLAGVAGLIFTSANGVRAFCAVNAARDLPVFAVGDRTALAAKASGFDRVASAHGDIDSLSALIIESWRPTDGMLLQVSGTVTAGDLTGRLQAEGYRVARVAVYEAVPAAALGTETSDRLKSGRLDGVMLFSPRTARHWAALLEKSGLNDATASLTAWCLSDAVAAQLASGEYRAVRIAERPTQAALLAALDKEKM